VELSNLDNIDVRMSQLRNYTDQHGSVNTNRSDGPLALNHLVEESIQAEGHVQPNEHANMPRSNEDDIRMLQPQDLSQHGTSDTDGSIDYFSFIVSTEEVDALSDIESNDSRSNEDEVRMSHSQNHTSQYESGDMNRSTSSLALDRLCEELDALRAVWEKSERDHPIKDET
jgi:hypothetical protein